MFRKASLAAAFASTLIFLAGCGGGSTGTTPTPGSPFISLSSNSLTFTSTVGVTSAAQTVTVTNTGNASATISNIVTIGSTANFTTQTTSTCLGLASLVANASCTLSFVFTPQAVTSYSATVTVTDNATPSIQAITLSGTGTAVPVATASLTSTSMTFPDTVSGATSAALNVTLTNTGGATLNIASIILGGPDFMNYTQTGCNVTTLAPNANCVISVTFSPTATATTYNASVTITDNSSTGTTQVITITGNGIAAPLAPQPILNPTTLNFPSTTVNVASVPQTTTLSNPGTAAPTNIVLSITGGATASAFTVGSTTCGTTLAINGSCTITVNFTPTIAGTFTASLNIADNATGSPQLVTLNGIATAVPAPQVTLSTNTISFPTTTVSTTSASYSTTLTNSGNAALSIASITLGGTNPTNFTKSTTCPIAPSTLAALGTCTISATFSPAAAIAYSAAFTITDNANNTAGSTQTVSLSGSGTTSSISYQLYELPDPGTGAGSGTLAALYGLVNNAQKTIDMTMYALSDTTFSGDLVAACKRGVIVRVVLDQNSEKGQDGPAYAQLNAQAGCSAVWANKAFNVTHEKSFIVDGTQMALMSLNLQTAYYATTRDFAMIYNDPVDIAAVQATFNADYAAGTPSSGVAGASDFSYQPGAGNDLIWSPTTAQVNMESIINNAKTTLIIDAEELTSSASYIVTDISNACKRGVTVRFTLENESGEYNAQLAPIKAAGCIVHYYSSSTGFYVHAKAVIADYGLSTQKVYLGSINYSNASMNSNRELGMYITDNASVQTLYTAMVSDYASATGVY